LDHILQNKSNTFGFNAFSDEYTDLIKDGVIDPVKVVRCALVNAASIASMMLTTETMIAEAPKKDNGGPAAGGMPGGMGGMGGMDGMM
jgi:chaperonin GroEL